MVIFLDLIENQPSSPDNGPAFMNENNENQSSPLQPNGNHSSMILHTSNGLRVEEPHEEQQYNAIQNGGICFLNGESSCPASLPVVSDRSKDTNRLPVVNDQSKDTSCLPVVNDQSNDTNCLPVVKDQSVPDAKKALTNGKAKNGVAKNGVAKKSKRKGRKKPVNDVVSDHCNGYIAKESEVKSLYDTAHVINDHLRHTTEALNFNRECDEAELNVEGAVGGSDDCKDKPPPERCNVDAAPPGVINDSPRRTTEALNLNWECDEAELNVEGAVGGVEVETDDCKVKPLPKWCNVDAAPPGVINDYLRRTTEALSLNQECDEAELNVEGAVGGSKEHCDIGKDKPLSEWCNVFAAPFVPTAFNEICDNFVPLQNGPVPQPDPSAVAATHFLPRMHCSLPISYMLPYNGHIQPPVNYMMAGAYVTSLPPYAMSEEQLNSNSGSSAETAEVSDVSINDSSSPDALVPVVPMVHEFLILSQDVGKLIGRGGRVVNKLRYDFGVDIVVRNHIVSGMSVCRIVGVKTQVTKTLERIRKLFPLELYPYLSLTQIFVTPESVVCPDSMKLSLPFGHAIDVSVSCAIDPDHIHIQQPTHDSYHHLQGLQHSLTQHYGSQTTPAVKKPVKGAICVAPVEFPNNAGGWFRVEIVDDHFQQFCLVKFLDYGGFHTLAATSLRQIHEKFLHLPFQSTECYLPIQPVGEVWSDEAKAAFDHLTRKTTVQCTVVGYGISSKGTQVPFVRLVRKLPEPELNINEEMVKMGFAFAVEPNLQVTN